MNKPSIFLVALLLVAFAACSAFPDDAAPTSTPTPSAIPTDSPTSTPSAADELAPGITRDGILNPVALMSAHQASLLESGFVVNQTVESTYDGQPSNRLELQTIVGPAGEVAYRTAVSSGFDAEGAEAVITNDLWINTTAQISRHIEDGSTTYDVQPRLYPPESLVWFGSLQRDIQFAAGEYEVTAVEQRNGVRVVTLEAEIDRVGNDGIVDTTSTLVVAETGVIRHAETAVTYEEGTIYRTTYDVIEQGRAAPEPPGWLDAVPPSAALDVGLDIFEFDETSIELVHLHGDAVPAGSIVSVVSNGTLYEVTLDAPFRDGSRYLWIDPTGTLRATESPPTSEEAESLDKEVTVQVHAPDGGELFSISVGRR